MLPIACATATAAATTTSAASGAVATGIWYKRHRQFARCALLLLSLPQYSPVEQHCELTPTLPAQKKCGQLRSEPQNPSSGLIVCKWSWTHAATPRESNRRHPTTVNETFACLHRWCRALVLSTGVASEHVAAAAPMQQQVVGRKCPAKLAVDPYSNPYRDDVSMGATTVMECARTRHLLPSHRRTDATSTESAHSSRRLRARRPRRGAQTQ